METLLKAILEKIIELISIVKIGNIQHDKDREDIKNYLERIEKKITQE